ncbi:MAG: pitrilysin family protein [Candidatus Faecousia sp.]|nr:pitrilysin family protein [Candidatus Faecousia sp.]
MITTTYLSPGIRLQCYTDNRFKQNALSIQYVRPMRREEAAMNALIPSVLLRGCKSAPDLRQITMRLDTLYGASVSPISRRSGDYQTTGFYVGMMDDRFAMGGEPLLEETLAFVGELLFDYPTENGGFLDAFVQGEKTNQIYAIEAERNDKRTYAAQQLLKKMCGPDSFGLPRMGEPEEVSAITPQALLRHYETLRRESPVELFYVGSAQPGKVEAALQKIFAGEKRDYRPLPPQTDLTPGPKQALSEAMEIAQGKLAMGYVTPITNRTPGFPAMQMLSTVFGGGMTSKLFQNVREKQSLCYSIGSGYYGAKGIVLVSAGIDFDKEQHVRQEVEQQLDACRRGEISQAEVDAARQSLISALLAVPDSPSSIENYYSTMTLNGCGMDPQRHRAALEAVTAEDLVAAAKTLELHSTYFLKGASL